MRKSILKLLPFCLSVLFLSAAEESETKEEMKPNILFIFADDWGWQDLSCHGHPYVKTPNIDRIAKEGADFHRFSVASGVCSPSRTAVMTGHFPARYSVNGHFAWVKDNKARNMPDWVDYNSPMLPRMLQQAGYHTGHFGKWHLSNNMVTDSPTIDYYGFHEFGAFNCSGEQMPYDHDADRAIKFMKTAQEEGKPFFINLWIHEPHTPFHIIPKYRQMFPELKDDADSIYAATLAYADERIGSVLDALDEMKIADNTVVIFSSDNGPARPQPGKELGLIYDSATGAGFDTGAAKGLTGGRKGAKGSLYEGGVGVPFLIRWPGKIQPEYVDKDTLISAVDLLPTFCEIARAKYPRGYKPDGVSMVSALTGKPAPKREKPLYWMKLHGAPNPEGNPNWASHVVLVDQYKLLTTEDQAYTELYHIGDDPLEQNNLLRPVVVETFSSEGITATEEEISAQMDQLKKEEATAKANAEKRKATALANFEKKKATAKANALKEHAKRVEAGEEIALETVMKWYTVAPPNLDQYKVKEVTAEERLIKAKEYALNYKVSQLKKAAEEKARAERKRQEVAEGIADRMKDRLATWMATLPESPKGNVYSSLRATQAE